MIDGKPTVFISYSERSKATVAIPFRDFVNSLGLHGVLVGEEPTPNIENPTPDRKVAHYLEESQMFVALATGDDRVDGGEVQTRQNISLEIGKAFDLSHLKRKVQIFKAPEVVLPSNINAVHEPFDPQNVSDCFALFERQARTFDLLGGHRQDPVPDEPTQQPEAEPTTGGDAHEVREAIEALRGLGDLLEGTDEEGAEDEAGSVTARAHLASLTALGLVRSVGLLGAHELNGLYRDRESVKPSEAEESTILSAMAANVSSANSPGWYWFRDRVSAEIQTLILKIARDSSDVSARRGAIKLLSTSPDRPATGELRDFIRAALSDDGVRSDALKLLESHGTTADLVAVKDALDSSSDTKGVEKMRLVVQARETPTSGFRTITTNPALIDPPIEAALISSSRKIPESAARKLLTSDTPAGRKLSLQILNAKSKLRKNDVIPVMTSDPDSSVRIMALEIAIKRRWKITEADFNAACADSGVLFYENRRRLAIDFFGQQDPVALAASLRSDLIRSYSAYEALAIRHFEVIKDRICNDLDSDFSTLIDDTEAAYRNEFRALVTASFEETYGADAPNDCRAEIDALVQEHMAPWRGRNAKHWDFMLQQFRLAALRGLAIHGNPDHAEYGRRFADDENWQIADQAIRLLGKTGDASDLPLLLQRAGASDMETSRTVAAEAALSVSPDSAATAQELLALENVGPVGAALSALRSAPMEGVFPKAVFPLLRSNSFEIREKATQFTLDRFDKTQRRLLADIYPKGQYYYSVITRIDRELYAPRWVKESAAAILKT